MNKLKLVENAGRHIMESDVLVTDEDRELFNNDSADEKDSPFTVICSDEDETEVLTKQFSQLGSALKYVHRLMDDEESLEKKSITSVELVSNSGSQIYLSMKWSDEEPWETIVDKSSTYTGFKDDALSMENLFSKVYNEIVTDDNSGLKGFREVDFKGERCNPDEVSIPSDGIAVPKKYEELVAKVADKYELDTRIDNDKDRIVIIIPDEE